MSGQEASWRFEEATSAHSRTFPHRVISHRQIHAWPVCIKDLQSRYSWASPDLPPSGSSHFLQSWYWTSPFFPECMRRIDWLYIFLSSLWRLFSLFHLVLPQDFWKYIAQVFEMMLYQWASKGLFNALCKVYSPQAISVWCQLFFFCRRSIIFLTHGQLVIQHYLYFFSRTATDSFSLL